MRVLSVFGTRLEAIKMAPVVRALEAAGGVATHHKDLTGRTIMTARQLAVHGLSYVGLPAAAMFVEAGLDVNAKAVDSINAYRPHIVKPGLDAALQRVVEAGKLRAALEPEPTEVHVITLSTSFKDEHVPYLSYIEPAAQRIRRAVT